MPWKEDEGNLSKDESGNPIWVDDKGNEESARDFANLRASLATANGEAGDRRAQVTRLEARISALASVTGEDLDVFKTELEDLRKIKRQIDRKGGPGDPDDDELHEKLYAANETVKTLEAKVVKLEEAAVGSGKTIRDLTVKNDFKGSKWFNDFGEEKAKTLLPGDADYDMFGKHFQPNGDGQSQASWTPGGDDIIMSQETPGEPAKFDEAIGLLIGKLEWKNRILPLEKQQGANLEAGHLTPGKGGIGKVDFSKSDAELMAEAHAAGGKT